MLFKKYFYLFLFFVPITILYSQENTISEMDSLAGKNFSDLRRMFYKYKNLGQLETAKKIALYSLEKGKKENNTKAVTNGYMRLCRINSNMVPKLALKYIDSCIQVATKHKHFELLAEGYFFKARTYFVIQDFEKALIFYVKAKKYFDETGNKIMYYAIYNNIGLIKQRVNAHEEALQIFKECYEYDKSLGYESMSLVDHLETISSIAVTYAAVDKRDSATLMNKEGYRLAAKTKTFNPLVFTRHEGANQYFNGNYIVARDSLLKAIPYLIKSNSVANLSYTYYQLGKISSDFSETKKAISYYKKIDSIFLESKYILPEPREIYETLINYYKDKDDVRKQLYFTERLLHVDSVLLRDYDELISTMHKEYDTPELRRQKKQLQESLNTKDKDIAFLLVLILIISSLSLLIIRYFYRKRKRNEENYYKIIESLKEQNKEFTTVKKQSSKKGNSLDIADDLINEILERLDNFEKNEGYLEPRLSLVKLSKQLETNNKYLSYIINTFKSKTYNTYLHELRINYAINRLQKDTTFRKYTIKAIAADIGYTNTESFTKAFYKKTGVSVSFFLKKIDLSS